MDTHLQSDQIPDPWNMGSLEGDEQSGNPHLAETDNFTSKNVPSAINLPAEAAKQFSLPSRTAEHRAREYLPQWLRRFSRG